jgi:pantetheine-phosphate adenylyltransferase
MDAAYEHEMLGMNRALYDQYETVFLFPGDNVRYISSSRVREILHLGGDVSLFVSPEVNNRIK